MCQELFLNLRTFLFFAYNFVTHKKIAAAQIKLRAGTSSVSRLTCHESIFFRKGNEALSANYEKNLF